MLSAAFGIVLLGLAMMAILAGPSAPAVGWVGVHSLSFLAVYMLAMRTIVAFERSPVTEMVEELAGHVAYKALTLKRAALRYIASRCWGLTMCCICDGRSWPTWSPFISRRWRRRWS